MELENSQDDVIAMMSCEVRTELPPTPTNPNQPHPTPLPHHPPLPTQLPPPPVRDEEMFLALSWSIQDAPSGNPSPLCLGASCIGNPTPHCPFSSWAHQVFDGAREQPRQCRRHDALRGVSTLTLNTQP